MHAAFDEMGANMSGQRWTYQETKMAFALYYLIPTTEIDKKNADVWRLAEGLQRTPRSVAMKLWNIAALDDRRVSQGKVGLKHGSLLDIQIWDEYRKRGDDFIWEGIGLLGSLLDHESLTPDVRIAAHSLREGGDRLVTTKQRINQNYFKNCLVQIYGNRCCITGLQLTELLVASHIKPWSACKNGIERVNPCNGLLLNALHDRSFDRGLITLSKDMKVIVSGKVTHTDQNDSWLWAYHGRQIQMPSCNPPAIEFIEFHQDCIFQG